MPLLEALSALIANMSGLFSSFISWLVQVVGQMGYPGIIGLMFLESSFFPFPSEVVVPPAGYLAWEGEMNLALVILSGIAGSILGALFNYWIALRWGRPIFEKYGKYLFITHESLDRADAFFAAHGHISTFTGRLLPVIRQYISLPAGLARMSLGQFCAYTALGSGIWVTILAFTGYFLGGNKAMIHQEITKISAFLIIGCLVLTAVYAVRYRGRKRATSRQEQISGK